MKIFEFKYKTGETDWIFASDLEIAKEFYINHTGVSEIHLDEYNITDVPESEWEKFYLLDINESEPDIFDEDDEDFVDWNEDDYHCGYKIEMNFKEYAEKNTTTDLIATTEF